MVCYFRLTDKKTNGTLVNHTPLALKMKCLPRLRVGEKDACCTLRAAGRPPKRRQAVDQL